MVVRRASPAREGFGGDPRLGVGPLRHAASPVRNLDGPGRVPTHCTRTKQALLQAGKIYSKEGQIDTLVIYRQIDTINEPLSNGRSDFV